MRGLLLAALLVTFGADRAEAQTIQAQRTAVVRGIHDCDTIAVTVELGFGVLFETGVRVYGVAAPEVTGAEAPKGLACRDRAIGRWLKIGDRVGLDLVKRDKYGRALAAIRLPSGEDLASALIAGGWALHYGGIGPMPRWPAAEPYPLTKETIP